MSSATSQLSAEAKASLPQHVAVIMDGNGRWANARGLTRVEGHKAGEVALLDVVAGAIEPGFFHVIGDVDDQRFAVPAAQ